MWGVSRPGWLSALPSPPDGGEEDEDEDEAGRMSDRRGASLLLLVNRWRGVAMWWRLHRPESDGLPSFPFLLRYRERVSGCDDVDGEDIRRSRRRGEERAKRSAASFALVLSLPGRSFPLPYITT